MSKEKKRIYPGELLKEARRKKRRRFKSLSLELGIQERYLEALEHNNFSIMAGPTYVKGYLRAYSKKLDLNPEIVIKAYNRFINDEKRKERKERKESKRKGIRGHKKNTSFKTEDYIVVIFIILFIAVLAIL